jgi:plastocyanin
MYQVVVGGPGQLVYTPNQITANTGDIVLFEFMTKNHTATQSSFAAPCEALAAGVDSGFMPNPSNTSPAPTFTYQVTSTSPACKSEVYCHQSSMYSLTYISIGFYCRQSGHCAQGMVFAINPTAAKSFNAFQAAAMAGTSGTASAAAVVYSSSTSSATLATAASVSSATSASVAAVSTVTGTSNGSGSCQCLCGAGSLPSGAGVGGFGGTGGSLDVTV